MDHQKAPKRIQSVTKALRIVREVSDAGEITLSELSERMETTMSTVYHLAQTLVAERFLSQNPNTKKYSLGPALLSIQSPSAARESLAELLYEPLVVCSTAIGFGVWAGVLQYDRVLYIVRASGVSPLRIDLPLHSLLPAYCASVGRMLLAALPREDALAMLNQVELKKYTWATCVDPDEIMHRVDMARVDGFCEVVHEHLDGVREVAVPVRGQGGVTVAVIGCGAPTNIFTANRRDETVRHLLDAARAAEAALGRID